MRYLLQRLALLPAALLLVNFLGFAYAHIVGPVQAAANPLVALTSRASPLLPAYIDYMQGWLRLDFGQMPPSNAPVLSAVGAAALASLGLLSLAMILSLVAGVGLGITAVRTQPAGVAGWLTLLTSAGLAMPAFYIGSLLILATLAYLISGPRLFSLPVQGYGWDAHLILPTLVLAARPTAQIAQVTASLLAGEMNKMYIVAARSVGYPWRVIRRRLAMQNIVAPVSIAVFGALRLLVGELILVEWLFSWPGLGSLLAETLLSSQSTRPPRAIFLHAPTLAATLTLFAALFLAADLVSGLIARAADPRLRATALQAEPLHG